MIGSIICVLDQIDPDIKTYGTVKFVEQDNEISELQWLYIRANNEELNTQFDPRFGTFWRIIEANSNYIASLEPPIK